MKRARVLIVAIGILLPFAARLPGILLKGPGWLAAYFEGGFLGVLFFSASNAICWGAVLLATRTYRSAESALYPAVLGFVPLAIGHMFLNLAADAQAAVALAFMPIFALPFVFVGWLVGRWFEN